MRARANDLIGPTGKTTAMAAAFVVTELIGGSP
jgi:hypothetical protein